MNRLLIILILVSFITGKTQAQDSLENKFDFWIGEWELTWINADSSVSHGANTIQWTHNRKVIHENFRALDGPLKGYIGSSWSVYNPTNLTWKQTWVDNQGAYLDFMGVLDGEKRIFQREAVTPKGNVLQRMVFHSFTSTGFTWDWESSTDGGENWIVNWQIEYRKKQ